MSKPFSTSYMFKKATLLILFFAITFVVFSQAGRPLSVDVYNRVPGLTLIDVITKEQMVGEIRMVSGLVGIILALDSNFKFTMSTFDCFSQSMIESGTWKILNSRLLELTSSKGRRIFDVVKYQSYYFFVEPVHRKKFLIMLCKETRHNGTASDVEIDGKLYTRQYVTPGYLNLDFFARQNKPE